MNVCSDWFTWSHGSVPAAGLPATVVSAASSSSSVAGHMMYPGGHTVMYATQTPSLSDGSLVLNNFPSTGHAQSHDPGTMTNYYMSASWYTVVL